MKVIPLSEAKANLSRYARTCKNEPVIVTVNGAPAFQLVPLDDDEDIVDQILEHNPKFERFLEARLKERSLSAKAAMSRL